MGHAGSQFQAGAFSEETISKQLTISIILMFKGELGAGAAGTVYRVKHKAEGGEVVFQMQLYLYFFLVL